jgi:site-specific DNA recombinase
MESDFERLLQDLRPTPGLVKAATFILKRFWDHRVESAKACASKLEVDLKRLDKSIEQFLERIVATDTPSLIKTYENKINSLEAEKIETREAIAKWRGPKDDFESGFRTALEFLSNPFKLWTSDAIEDKRTVLKLVFQERLAYVRGKGFRTAQLAIPFKFINGLDSAAMSDREMVDPTGIEPVTLRV